ncbi:hypothetical protein Leryth_009896 [Lithospermum erythrorhizon]|nr:hypothetical protein Leryth_009896 [Lithospermum erythrorhizon]
MFIASLSKILFCFKCSFGVFLRNKQVSYLTYIVELDLFLLIIHSSYPMYSAFLKSSLYCTRVQFSGDLVTSIPDVLQVTLGPEVEFVILASDGLWDYIKSSQAVKYVRNQLREHGDVQMASEALARLALDRQSQDNISIVIADLGRTDWRSLPSMQRQNFVIELVQAVATMGVVSIGIWMFSLLS